MRILALLALTGFLPALSACGERQDQPPPAAEVIAFSSQYVLQDSVTFAQSDSFPVVDVTSFDRRSDGTYAVADAGEGQVRIHAADGSLVRVIGRKGRGPNEFILPTSVRWDAQGRLHVLDAQRLEMAVLSPDGTPVRRVSLSKIGAAYDFGVRPAGGYVFLLARYENDLLQLADSAGRPERTLLPLARYLPAGQRDEATWRTELSPTLRMVGDTALVTLAIADSLWTVDLSSRRISARSVRPPNYLAPTDPDGPLDDPAEEERWNSGFERAIALVRPDHRTFITFSRYYPDSISTRLVELEGDRMRVLEGAPTVTRAYGGRLVSVRGSEDRYTLLFWGPR